MLERSARWQRRRQRFFSSRIEAMFSIGVLLVAVIAGSLALTRWAGMHGREVLEQLREHGLTALLISYVAAVSALISRGAGLRSLWRRSWLAALFTPADLGSALRFDVLANAGIGWAIASLLVLLCGLAPGDSNVAAPVMPLAGIAAVIALSSVTALWLLQSTGRIESAVDASSRSAAEPRTARQRSITSLAAWQAFTALSGVRPPALALPFGALLLLVPGGEGPIVILALLLGGGCAFVPWAAWRRAMQTTLIASAWLRAQPLRPGQLLMPLLLPAFGIALIGGVLTGPFLAFLGFGGPLAAMIVLAAMAIALLHAACVASGRHQPARIGWRFSFCLILLLAMLEAWPPLTPLLWLATVVVLGTQALRQ